MGSEHEFLLYWLIEGCSGTLIAWEYEQKTGSLHACLFAENQWYQFCRANQSGPDCKGFSPVGTVVGLLRFICGLPIRSLGISKLLRAV